MLIFEESWSGLHDIPAIKVPDSVSIFPCKGGNYSYQGREHPVFVRITEDVFYDLRKPIKTWSRYVIIIFIYKELRLIFEILEIFAEMI